ncbi:MAG: SAM-dependent methyltransferase, partial [Bacteroidota bacterium]
MKTMVFTEKELLKKGPYQKVLDIIDFYNEATEDYKFWSSDYNMHFGYFSHGRSNPLKRDSMLNEMNRQVLKRLGLPSSKSLLADLGCGMGATIRYALQRNPKLSAIGVTLSHFQVSEGNKLLGQMRGTLLNEDFNVTSLSSNSADGA